MTSLERVYAAVDLDAVSHNMNLIHDHLNKETQITAVIKADAYGHGAVPIAKELEDREYLYGFCVATAEEALELRHAGIEKPILVLGYVFDYAIEDMIREKIRFCLFREDMIEKLEKEAIRQNQKALVHIKIDTGMTRIGIRPDEEGLRFCERVVGCKEIQVEGIFTHFAKADEEDKTDTFDQFRIFWNFCCNTEEKLGIKIPIKHCANSASILRMKEIQLDCVREGIILYGLWPQGRAYRLDVDLRPAMSLKSTIIYLKEVEAGTPVSYGGSYITDKRTMIATVPVGYADGYPRSLSGKGYVLVKGQRAPILGRVCMDQFMIDVTHIRGVKEGEEVVLLGKSRDEQITMEELGEWSGRFNYEWACLITKRVPRIYLKNGQIKEI